ncbi:MAG: hypothetical protein ACXADB_12700 [Candidatus Hermodarchaeia archaeon]|jgi:hypothetical protein
MLEAMQFCKLEDRAGRPVYVVNPAIMYPAVIARMKEIKAGANPEEVADPEHPAAVPNWRSRCRQVTEHGYQLALTPREEVSEEEAPFRAGVLALAWKFYKVALRNAGAEVSGSNKVLHCHLLNENSGEFDVDFNPIKSAYRF